MKIEDVRDLAKEKNIPNHFIDRIISEIEVDENGDVKDELAVLFVVNETAYNFDVIRGNLEAVKKMRENRQKKSDITE